MRTDPLSDTLTFLAAAAGDQLALGPWRWVLMALLAALVLGGLLAAAYAWAADPAQRTGRDLGLFAARFLVGLMWFENLFWKLPVSTGNGLHYWTGLETKDAAFRIHATLIETLALPDPNFLVLNVAVLAIELAFAASLILGLGVRLAGAVGVLFVAQLWLGLYRNAQEWPWSYVFLMLLMGLFALLAAGRSLGLDATLRRSHPPDMTDGALGTLVRIAT
ncbi:DoxX family protein [Methylobacterium sp. NEAU K]|uniref:DoxX family protein n=1 Tax=Methylobacterium sp. NEAU K TaxID=3064946 RepID=UPI0027356D09|nr:DoxX family protein [Methylobacterium sp. NEAU K]MDP4006579.1 DoxX family protein [Methylobacterium sp. NEAU K]